MTEVEVRLTEAPSGFAQGIESVPFLMAFTIKELPGLSSMEISLHKALFGFGDAVCVPVVEWIAKNYLNPLWEELH